MNIGIICLIGYIMLAIRYYQYIPYSKIIYYNLNIKSRKIHSKLVEVIFYLYSLFTLVSIFHESTWSHNLQNNLPIINFLSISIL